MNTGSPPTEAETIARLLKSVSPSRLALFSSCRLKFYFRHVLRVPKPKTAALHLGSSVHSVLRAWNRARWRQEVPAAELMYAAYTAAWIAAQAEEPVTWESPEIEEEQKRIGWRLLETFFRETTIRPADKPEAVEVQVEADLSTHGLPRLNGILDVVQQGCIIDFKTSGQTPNPDRVAMTHGIQTTIYALLYRANTDRKENGIELHHLVKLKQPKLVVTKLDRASEAQVSRLYRLIESYVAGLQRRDFVPSPGLQCVSCEFFHECNAWPG